MIDLKELPERTNSVYRWAGVPIIGHRNTLSEHSFAVSHYALMLYKALDLGHKRDVDLGKLLQYCLIHDVPEVVTSDIPAVVKMMEPDIKSILDRIEDKIYNEDLKLINITPSYDIKFVCKAADYIAILREFNIDFQLGNKSPTFLDAIPAIKKIRQNLYDKFSDYLPWSFILETLDYIDQQFGHVLE